MIVAVSLRQLMPEVLIIPPRTRSVGIGRDGLSKRISVLSAAADRSDLERSRSGAIDSALFHHGMANDQDASA